MNIGEKIAGQLTADSNLGKEGSIIALSGPLGAGKTCLAKGIARFFSINDEVTSPTYTIISEYEGKKDGKALTLSHIDAYRLKGEDDFIAIGGEEYLYSGGISVIEWSERISGCLPAHTHTVTIEITGGNSRIIHVTKGKP